MSRELMTNDQYWAAQPPQVRELRSLHEPELSTRAHELADAGFLVDVPIHVWKWAAELVMLLRDQQGLTWVPSANQEPLNLAGDALKFGFAGRSYDPKHAPPGSIRISMYAEDYPPFDPPAPPPIPSIGPPKYVSFYTGVGNRYYSTPEGRANPAGDRVGQDGSEYRKLVIPGLMGNTHLWEKV